MGLADDLERVADACLAAPAEDVATVAREVLPLREYHIVLEFVDYRLWWYSAAGAKAAESLRLAAKTARGET